MRLCGLGLTQAKTVARHGTRAASVEVELGTELLRAACNGARSSLEAKLSSLTDAVYLTSVVEEMARLNEEATTAATAVRSSLQIPPA
jgi:formiminotetrahydrofolate cyclodeaminase